MSSGYSLSFMLKMLQDDRQTLLAGLEVLEDTWEDLIDEIGDTKKEIRDVQSTIEEIGAHLYLLGTQFTSLKKYIK